MMQYVSVPLPEGHFLKLLFIRMNEEDSWVCHMEDDLMNEVQKIIGQGFYGSI